MASKTKEPKEPKVCICRVSCPFCHKGRAGIFQCNDRKNSIYMRCPHCDALTFGHHALVTFINEHPYVDWDSIKSHTEWRRFLEQWELTI